MCRRFTPFVMLVAAALVGGCSVTTADDQSTRDSAGDVVEGGEVGAFRLQVGDCLAEAAVGDVKSVPVVPCTDPHDTELYHSFDLPDGDFPGEEAVIASAEEGCLAEFEAFIGATYESSIYDVSYLYPTEQSWTDLDDRTVLCGVFLVDGTAAVESAAGIGK